MANIFQQYLTPPKSVMDYTAELDQAETRKQSLRQNALVLAADHQKLVDQRRERDGEARLSQLLAAGGTPDQVAAELALSGYGKQALAFTKQQQELAKSKADAEHTVAQTGKIKSETGKIDYEQRESKRQKAVTDIAAFTDSQQALASLDLHEKAGDIAPEQAAMIRQSIPTNPADFPKWQISMLQRILSAKDAIGQLAPDANTVANNTTSAANNAATNATSRANNASTVAATIRGQNLADRRAREQIAQGRVPSGYRQNADGTLTAIPGGPADKHAVTTEGERKAATLLSRLTSSRQQLAAALEADPTAAKPGLMANGLRMIGAEAMANTGTSSARQRVEAAQLDILDAALTLGTGAAYTREQLEGYRKSYFPQLGDADETIKEKQDRLNNIIQAAEISAGRAAPKADVGRGAATAPAPNIDELLKKYGQ